MNTPTAAPSQRGENADILVGPEPAVPRVHSVEALTGHRIHVVFADGEARIFDLGRLLNVGGFARLASEDAFVHVAVDDAGGGVVWKAGPDLSGDTIYYAGERVA